MKYFCPNLFIQLCRPLPSKKDLPEVVQHTCDPPIQPASLFSTTFPHQRCPSPYYKYHNHWNGLNGVQTQHPRSPYHKKDTPEVVQHTCDPPYLFNALTRCNSKVSSRIATTTTRSCLHNTLRIDKAMQFRRVSYGRAIQFIQSEQYLKADDVDIIRRK